MLPFRSCLALAVSAIVTVAAQADSNHSFSISGDGFNITDKDIVEYRFAEHTLVVPTTAALTLDDLTSRSLSGIPFHVKADGELIYSGLVVPMVSSMSYPKPTIWVGGIGESQPTTTLEIHRVRYPESVFSKDADPRFDERIRRSLAAVGKLREGDVTAADFDPALTDSIATVLRECQALKPGTPRSEILRHFMAEGGLSMARRQTYVHRRCPYIKIDVEFGPTSPGQEILDEHASDPLTKVSKPYLNWSILD